MQFNVLLLLLLLFVFWSTDVESAPPYNISRTQNTGFVGDLEQIESPAVRALLTDINLRLQQHDQEQRLDKIQQLQQTILQQQQIQRQADGIELMRQLQMNISAEIQQLARRHDNVTPDRQSAGILMQQHYGGSSFFSKTWAEYKAGFGDVNSNYWIGNERLHALTKDGDYKLRVDLLAKQNNQWYWAEYQTFRVFDETSGYSLNIGGYSGTAGNSLIDSNGKMFSTKDSDRDLWSNNCAVDSSQGNGAGFWYNACGIAFPNSPHEGTLGFAWGNLPVGTQTWPAWKLLVSRFTLIRK